MATNWFRIAKEMFKDAGYEVRSYSGRSMYGRKCLGVELDRGKEPCEAVLEAVAEYALNAEDAHDVRSFAGFLGSVVKTDSMGTGSIVYFPEIAWEEG